MMIEIKQIQLHQIAEIKRIIIAVCNEIWQVPEEVIRRYDAMTDLDDVRSHYYENNGTFLVAIADGRVIGSGAIRRLNDDICELKRMWFLKDYRGQGLATKMTQILLDFARKTSYKQVRLDIADQQKQAQALKFYKRLGFYPIERYNDGPCTVFMEKMLWKAVTVS